MSLVLLRQVRLQRVLLPHSTLNQLIFRNLYFLFDQITVFLVNLHPVLIHPLFIHNVFRLLRHFIPPQCIHCLLNLLIFRIDLRLFIQTHILFFHLFPGGFQLLVLNHSCFFAKEFLCDRTEEFADTGRFFLRFVRLCSQLCVDFIQKRHVINLSFALPVVMQRFADALALLLTGCHVIELFRRIAIQHPPEAVRIHNFPIAFLGFLMHHFGGHTRRFFRRIRCRVSSQTVRENNLRQHGLHLCLCLRRTQIRIIDLIQFFLDAPVLDIGRTNDTFLQNSAVIEIVFQHFQRTHSFCVILLLCFRIQPLDVLPFIFPQNHAAPAWNIADSIFGIPAAVTQRHIALPSIRMQTAFTLHRIVPACVFLQSVPGCIRFILQFLLGLVLHAVLEILRIHQILTAGLDGMIELFLGHAGNLIRIRRKLFSHALDGLQRSEEHSDCFHSLGGICRCAENLPKFPRSIADSSQSHLVDFLFCHAFSA